MVSCHLQTMTVLLLPFQFPFLFLFSFWLLWLGLPKLCWIEVARVDILVLFLTLQTMLSAFTTENVSCEFVTYGLCYVEVYSLYTYITERFYHEQIWILSYAFSVSIENTFHVTRHVDWFACVESSLLQWNKSHWSWRMSSVLLK